MKLNEPSALAYGSYEVFCTDNVFQNFNTLTGYLKSGLALSSGLKEVYNSFGKYSKRSAEYDIKCGTFTAIGTTNFNISDFASDRILVENAGLSSVNGTYKEYMSYNDKPRYSKNNYNQEIFWSGNKWIIYDRQDPNSMNNIYKSNSDVYYPSDAINWDYYNLFTLNGIRSNNVYNPIPSLTLKKKLSMILDTGSGFFNLYIPPTDLTTGIYLSGKLTTLTNTFDPYLSNGISLIVNYSGSSTLTTNNTALIGTNSIYPGIVQRKIAENTQYNFIIDGTVNLTNGLSLTISNPGVLPLDFLSGRGSLSTNNKYDNNCYFTGLILPSENNYVSLNNAQNLVNSEQVYDKEKAINYIYDNECTGCFYTINFSLPCPVASLSSSQSSQIINSVNEFSFAESYIQALDELSSKMHDCLYSINLLAGTFYTGDQSLNLYNSTPSDGYTSASITNIHYKSGEYDPAYLQMQRDLKARLLNLSQSLANNTKILEDDLECCPGLGCDYAYIGFGGSTGSAREKHEILAFTFKNPHAYITYNQEFLNEYFNIIGDAYIDTNNNVVLTEDVYQSAGNFYYKNPILFRDCKAKVFPFSVHFAMRMTHTSSRADGITFIIQSAADTAGGVGGGMGYYGIPQSIGVGFDTYYNADINDINNNHVEINLDGSVQSQQVSLCPTDLSDGRIKHVWIDYDENRTIRVYIADDCCINLNLYSSAEEALWDVSHCQLPYEIATICGTCWGCISVTTTTTTTSDPNGTTSDPNGTTTTTTTSTTTTTTTPMPCPPFASEFWIEDCGDCDTNSTYRYECGNVEPFCCWCSDTVPPPDGYGCMIAGI
jgi:phage gpG-like protein